ncbi:hypothetical protein AURDEDRAFT_115903 [Auricularia subglabra TFB-10046 SS5]|nr:hypothetical protein AURDEDRAFT_115903 [Auricularia subglabra TFB-10046 SS5]
MFLVKTVLFGVLVAALAKAAPEPPRASALAVDTKLVAIKTEVTPVGELVFYGLPQGVDNTTALKPGDVHKRCGTDIVHCDGVHAVPNADPCGALIYGGLQYNNDILPDAARAICVTTHGMCCISWSKPTYALRNSALFYAAVKTFGGCVVHGASGRTTDTNLNGVCAVQCLSNRPDGCA